jgi:aryl-alcohol dehydrogenase-like predicted oxidoreductase
MNYRELGRTGLKVSVVGLGSWQFGGEWGKRFSQAEVDALVGRTRELGINLIDTAECYGDHLAESLIGRAIDGSRDDWIIATKFGHRFQQDRMTSGSWSPGDVRSDHWSPPEVLAQLERSLRALRRDYVDLYLFHSGADEVFDRDELWMVLDEQVKRGKIRHLGISLGPSDNLHQTARASAVGADVIELTYNRLNRVAEQAVLESCREQRLGVLAREPLANGYLSGKYRTAGVTGSDDWRSSMDEREVRDRIALVEEIRDTEVPAGVPMAEWALAWALRHPAVSAVITGTKSLEQLESSASAAELDLQPDAARRTSSRQPRIASGGHHHGS